MNTDLFVRNIKRKTFGKVSQIALPDLIEIQKDSYRRLLQMHVAPDSRKNTGLQAVFKSIFPVEDYAGTYTLEFQSYNFEKPRYDVDESRQRGGSYVAHLKATLRLVLWDVDATTGSREVRGIKEQEVYLGDVPLMTDKATFVINGVERVIVSQMHRSPGVFFDHDKGKGHLSGKYLYSAHIIPYRGSWLDFEFDPKDVLYFRIDRRRKLLASTLLFALGMNSQEIYDAFYDKVTYTKHSNGWSAPFVVEGHRAIRLSKDLINAHTGKVVATAGTKLNKRIVKELEESGLREVLVSAEELVGKYLAHTIKIDDNVITAGEELTADMIAALDAGNVKTISVLDVDQNTRGAYIRHTLKVDKNESEESALADIFRTLRPGEPITYETSKLLFEGMFFSDSKYDLSEVGRIKLNSRLGLNTDASITYLTKEDILSIIKSLILLRDGIGIVDDIDDLSNRRVRSVGELVENQLRLALVRIERTVLERMSTLDIDSVMPNDLINSKLLVNALREFFGTSQLSQFMDQTNPLSEVTHKRRISALGPGGLTRDRAGFEVRDVHITHYGRICPIETPEGQNIGLINSLSSFARVNKYGFIETPYRKVESGQVGDEVFYLSAVEEKGSIIAQANVALDKNKKFVDSSVSCRKNGEFVMVPSDQVNYMDVNPMQLVSVAAALIPFLGNTDANRALMGSNMQRQAVPLLISEAPLVGTGIEGVVAKDSGAAIVATRSGIIDKVDSSRIVVKYESEEDNTPGVDIYSLRKFQRSNYNTCITQRPLVKVGDVVQKGDVIGDGPSTDRGELALGKNVLVAFMSWNGYNYEDSILISEKVVREDKFTSVHIEELSLVARDTRLGPEEITRELPNANDEALKNLDESGIIRIGAYVKPGDILVGKVTPKTESPVTPEEKLLRAIFGEKAADVKDSSLHVPPGISGTVVEVRVFSRRGIEKDQRALTLEKQEIQKLNKDKEDEIYIIEDFVYPNLRSLLMDKVAKTGPKGVKSGANITEDILSSLSSGQLWQVVVEDKSTMKRIFNLKERYDSTIAEINERYEGKVMKVQIGDDLSQGVLKEVKIFVAMKHKLQPGDKMAGRYGNKGVISRILPEEDMPFLDDGTVVDIVLSPLGIPSRMNIGQIFETNLGWASAAIGKQMTKMLDNMTKPGLKTLKDFLMKLYSANDDLYHTIDKANPEELLAIAEKLSKGIYFATPVFDGATVEDINQMCEIAGVDKSGQSFLRDGKSGEYFDRPVTVGYAYMLKLHHLVDDKMHARSVGPYSLVTQQPLGGKSHFGGQRLGEMECWALQAYGAAYTLQEMLTVKSDDVTGRVKMFESIIRGDNTCEMGIPESFNVMVKEIRSLCLNIELEKSTTN